MADSEQLEEDKRCTLFTKAKHFCQRCNEFHAEADWAEGCERYIGAEPIRQCRICTGWHPADRIPGNCVPEPNWLLSELSSPSVISDTISFHGVKSMTDGRRYDSKAKLRQAYRAAGVIELGNEKPKPFERPKPDRRKIKEAIGRAVSAVENGARVENFRRQNRNKTVFGAVAK